MLHIDALHRADPLGEVEDLRLAERLFLGIAGVCAAAREAGGF